MDELLAGEGLGSAIRRDEEQRHGARGHARLLGFFYRTENCLH